MSAGTARIASYEIAVIVGRIINARTSEPANHENPRVKPAQAKFSRRNGTRIVIPSQPYTTLGIPTKTSIDGCVMERAQRGATSPMNSARPTDSGVAMTAATSITPIVPRMNGSMPYDTGGLVGSGSHVGSKIAVSETPDLVKSWRPFQEM